MKQRNINLDLIRCMAIFSVISVHFFYNNEFYSTPIDNPQMVIMVYLRTLFMICVPLFLLLTGYLMNHKTLSKDYYKGIIPILIQYVIISIICLIFRICYYQTSFTVDRFLISITDFSADRYSWYINMYIGLFLLIPFLNILYHNLKEKEKKYFIITLLLLTIIPTLLNSLTAVDFYEGVMSNYKYEFLPDWWFGLYPIVYYYLGAYLKEHPIHIPYKCFLFILCLGLFGSFNLFKSLDHTFIKAGYNAYYGFQPFILSLLIFTSFLDFKLEYIPLTLKKFIVSISKVSLSMYLISYIFDRLVYPFFNKWVASVGERLYYMPIVILLVFFCSYFAAMIIYQFTYFLQKQLQSIKKQ